MRDLSEVDISSFRSSASLRMAAHHWDTPTLDEVGGSVTPGGVKPSLLANPSRMPGKKLASRG